MPPEGPETWMASAARRRSSSSSAPTRTPCCASPRRYSLCADDAHDAYQRGLEILMRHAARLDPERAAGWLHTVVNHHNDTRSLVPVHGNTFVGR